MNRSVSGSCCCGFEEVPIALLDAVMPSTANKDVCWVAMHLIEVTMALRFVYPLHAFYMRAVQGLRMNTTGIW